MMIKMFPVVGRTRMIPVHMRIMTKRFKKFTTKKKYDVLDIIFVKCEILILIPNRIDNLTKRSI